MIPASQTPSEIISGGVLKTDTSKIDVACYYFPNYHPGDIRNERHKGRDWCEWELVKDARPRFPEHRQPKVPAWGYEDESDPSVMAKKIDAAADHGINAFIFDWYYYNDGPFLERALENGFLNATNNHRLSFALMWANHDWVDIHPSRRGVNPTLLYPGKITAETFDRITDYVVERYFKHPSYWKLSGSPYFSVYEISKLLESFGSVDATRGALDAFRGKVKQAGFPDLHLNAVVWGQTILPGEQTPANVAELVGKLGFDSVTSYVWIHHVGLQSLQTDYRKVFEQYLGYYDETAIQLRVPYFPNVTMGWDSSPRAYQADPFGNFGYPFMNTIGGNTPERFHEALVTIRDRVESRGSVNKVVTINCWNEWTEGSYLEPDTENGMAYLQAVRDVFR